MLGKSYKIVIPTAPRGKQRPRFSRPKDGGHVRAYTPKETVLAENWVRLQCTQQAGTPCLREPVWVELEFIVPIPANMPKRERADALSGRKVPQVKPDLDNATKLVLDALNGIAWADDNRVARLVAFKRYGLNPCTVVAWGPIQGSLADALL